MILLHELYVILLAMTYCAIKVVRTGEVVNCNEAQKVCMSQLGCSIALHNYMINCSPLIHGETSECSRNCQMALISLLSIEAKVGETFMTCECNDDGCTQQKARLDVCSRPVMEAMQTLYDDSTTTSCNLATLICMADSPCVTALEFYNERCRGLVRGDRCTDRCNNSLSILYRQPKAHKLRNCECDGTENYDCIGLRMNTERLCFTKRHRHGHNNRTRTHTRPHEESNYVEPIHYDYDESYSKHVVSATDYIHESDVGLANQNSFSCLCIVTSYFVILLVHYVKLYWHCC